jgi:hypothetical protein
MIRPRRASRRLTVPSVLAVAIRPSPRLSMWDTAPRCTARGAADAVASCRRIRTIPRSSPVTTNTCRPSAEATVAIEVTGVSVTAQTLSALAQSLHRGVTGDPVTAGSAAGGGWADSLLTAMWCASCRLAHRESGLMSRGVWCRVG